MSSKQTSKMIELPARIDAPNAEAKAEKLLTIQEATKEARTGAVKDVRAFMRWEAKQGAPLPVLFNGALSAKLYDVVVSANSQERMFILPNSERVKITTLNGGFGAGVQALYTACKRAQTEGHKIVNINAEKKRIELVDNSIRVIA